MDTLPILIVEDDHALRILLSALFTHHRITHDAVPDGEQAIECIRRKRYAAILLDLMLPGTNGFDVLQYISAEKPVLMSRVLVMTAASQQTLSHFDKSSIGGLLHKPFDIHDLVEKTRSISQTEWPEVRAVGMMPRISSYRVH